MTERRATRKLAAILAADIAASTRVTAADEISGHIQKNGGTERLIPEDRPEIESIGACPAFMCSLILPKRSRRKTFETNGRFAVRR